LIVFSVVQGIEVKDNMRPEIWPTETNVAKKAACMSDIENWNGYERNWFGVPAMK
jgi:hypothetical protein